MLNKLIIILLFLPGFTFAQLSAKHQAQVDSLKGLISAQQDDSTLIALLSIWDNLIYVSDPELDLELNKRIESIANRQLKKDLSKTQKKFFLSSLANTLNNLGNSADIKGDYSSAIDYYNKSLSLNDELGNTAGKSGAISNIGLIYKSLGDLDRAIAYQTKSLALRMEIGDYKDISTSWASMAEIFEEQGDIEKAFLYHEKSLKYRSELSDLSGMASSNNHIGGLYVKQGSFSKAMMYFKESLELSKKTKDQEQMAITMNSIGTLKYKQGQYLGAIKYGLQSLEISQKNGIALQIKNAAEILWTSYKSIGKTKQALKMYELFIKSKMDLASEKFRKEMVRQEYKFKYDKKAHADSIKSAEESKVKDALLKAERIENKQRGQQTNFLIFGLLTTLIFLGIVVNRFRITRKQNVIIEKEKERSEELLLNILPAEIAEELKNKGTADTQLIKNATVLFTDFKGFTAISELLSPQKLIHEINVCFSAFDQIMEKHNIEKIKTIGDAYMAAGGLPSENHTHPIDAVQAAIKIQEFMREYVETKKASNEPFFEIRIGVHTGPVVAGIVGLKKFQYDIWGDTVNTASRMESSGAAGMVNISEATYEVIKENKDYTFESRGKIKAKGKGLLEMFFVHKKVHS